MQQGLVQRALLRRTCVMYAVQPFIVLPYFTTLRIPACNHAVQHHAIIFVVPMVNTTLWSCFFITCDPDKPRRAYTGCTSPVTRTYWDATLSLVSSAALMPQDWSVHYFIMLLLFARIHIFLKDCIALLITKLHCAAMQRLYPLYLKSVVHRRLHSYGIMRSFVLPAALLSTDVVWTSFCEGLLLLTVLTQESSVLHLDFVMSC